MNEPGSSIYVLARQVNKHIGVFTPYERNRI